MDKFPDHTFEFQVALSGEWKNIRLYFPDIGYNIFFYEKKINLNVVFWIKNSIFVRLIYNRNLYLRYMAVKNLKCSMLQIVNWHDICREREREIRITNSLSIYIFKRTAALFEKTVLRFFFGGYVVDSWFIKY